MSEMSEPRFFYQAGGKVHGPMTRSELQIAALNGAFRKSALVRQEGGEWRPAELFGLSFSSPSFKILARAMKFLLVVGLAIAALVWWNWPSGFSDADIERVKTSIREKYREQGSDLSVEEVTMLRKERRELVGFVKLRSKGSTVARTVDCSATMDADGRNFIWRCGL